jgi:hypothetical protein
VGIALDVAGPEAEFPKIVAVLPDTTFDYLWRAFSACLAAPAAQYNIVIDFLAFGHGSTEDNLPSFAEFASGAPFITREFSVNVSPHPLEGDMR